LPAGLGRVPQPVVAPPITRTEPMVVPIEIPIEEVTATLADGVGYTYWTFGGTVPGPMIRVLQGDTVELTLRNPAGVQLTHSINLHAVTGPGGGAEVTQVPPGGQAAFSFKALHPGVYVYHCMTPMIPHHVAQGMYGLIVVEPPGGFPKVDHEYYLMQGEFYLQGDRGQPGLRTTDFTKLLDERPDYVLFNGGATDHAHALTARVGETARIFFGVGGPNMDSSFHVVGESFDRVYPDGNGPPLTNIQTTLVGPGAATMVELSLDAPGMYMIEDHHMSRMQKGAQAFLMVDGPDNPAVFRRLDAGGN
jgi:nitrite reductase (NO-forming)